MLYREGVWKRMEGRADTGRYGAGATLAARCFGAFRVAGNGGWREGPEQRRARELIQYLVLHPHGIASRERLIDVLWGGESSDLVLHRLHAAVSGARGFLRDVLGGLNAIRHGDEGYGWHPDVQIECDADRFSRLYRAGSPGAIAEAVGLYTGELLAANDGDWVRPLRVRFSTMYATMLERMANDALTTDIERALNYALTLQSADRAHEGAVRVAIRAFAALGRRRQAFEEYESLRDYLRKTLGIDPMPETTATLRAALE